MKKYSLSAFVAAGLLAGGLSVTSANAADLGGNCCADLEERIAELEATTARKGNRKVSLTVSGWVAQQVMYWDDGVESNTYITDIGTTLASHVKFTGQATISPGWNAGYVLHLEANSNESLLGVDADTPQGPNIISGTNGGVEVLQSYWFIKSDTLGKVSIGKQSQASDNTAILVDGSGSLVPANFVAFDYGGFQARNSANGNNMGSLFGFFGCNDCNGYPTNNVRYDSPTFGGFSFSASWGEDDFWDVAARYAGEFGGFKVAVAGAYAEASRLANTFTTLAPADSYLLLGADSEFFQVGAYVQHVPTGLFVYGAYTNNEVDVAGAVNTESETFYIKAGLRKRLNPLGHTVFYGEYEQGGNEVGGVDVTEAELWGLGVVQEIDAAAMSMWLTYRHIEPEFEGVGAPDLEDFDYVKFGALINF